MKIQTELFSFNHFCIYLLLVVGEIDTYYLISQEPIRYITFSYHFKLTIYIRDLDCKVYLFIYAKKFTCLYVKKIKFLQ